MTTSYAEQLLFARLSPQGKWTREALCARSGTPDLWFPRPNTSQGAMRDTEKAKTICGQCPVRSACLQWAMDARESHGVWGGLTEQERERLRKAKK